MKFLTTIRKLWFPNTETKILLKDISERFGATLAEKNKILAEHKAARDAKAKELRNLEDILNGKVRRSSDLKYCFEDKSELYETLENLKSRSKSIQSEIDAAHQKVKKNQAAKNDYYNWSNRKKSIWNGYSGRGGKKIRSQFNPKSIFNKYSRGDLARFKSNIERAKNKLDHLHSERHSNSSDIEETKSHIGAAKDLCKYFKTQEGKAEVKKLEKEISTLELEKSQIENALAAEEAKVSDQTLSIKSTKIEWRDKRRRTKLAQQ